MAGVTISTKAVITGPSGFYYREEHEWREVSPDAQEEFEAAALRISRYITKAGNDKDDGDLSATLDATIDGKAQPTINVSGISRRELTRFQRFMHGIERDFIELGAAHGERKARKG